MAILMMMNYGNYTNKDAVSKVIRYITRSRAYENKANELICYGGMGILIYSSPDQMIQEFRYVQNLYRIDTRNGRRMYHEVLCMDAEEERILSSNFPALYQLALECCMEYYKDGHQVVFAVHRDDEKRLHIHFAVNTINFKTGRKWHTKMNETKDRNRLFQMIVQKYCSIILNQINQNVAL